MAGSHYRQAHHDAQLPQQQNTAAADNPPEKEMPAKKKSTFGVLADKETDEVPGTVRLLSNSIHNKPLGEDKMEHHKREEHSHVPPNSSVEDDVDDTKRTADGKIVLFPQPEDTPNDPLNWPAWRRDCALLSLGFYCMLGGGMTPILAAGFNNVAATFDVTFSQVALTTGLYMMGLGVGSVIFAPTAILFGKRTIYLASSVLFVVSSVWCALAPDYANLVVARVFQGVAVSPVECLPSATIAEIFFLHERAFRVGIYTLLLLGGKNLIPLVSAAIIEAKDWRWVFWIVTIVVGFGALLLFFFVPETFWDRTPHRWKSIKTSSSRFSLPRLLTRSNGPSVSRSNIDRISPISPTGAHPEIISSQDTLTAEAPNVMASENLHASGLQRLESKNPNHTKVHFDSGEHSISQPHSSQMTLVTAEKSTVPGTDGGEDRTLDHPAETGSAPAGALNSGPTEDSPVDNTPTSARANGVDEKAASADQEDFRLKRYTSGLRNSPPRSYLQTLRPWNGRLSQENWAKVALRPFILYAYPAVLWSSMVYALSVGWLIVLSEAVARVYETRDTYNFSALQVGLVYLSPFIGGVLGTAVAGRVSDIIVQWMTRRNHGIYEPEFRLVMAIPIAICTAVGLMGFGWSAEERDNFMVPTIFFGIISFGCCIGSTTAITFCVDSYRQFAAEALVTLNFSKNILHGLIWSLFFPQWLQASGSKEVFLAIGGIQIGCLLFTIPVYIYGKRARMWTVRMKMMERF